MLAPLAVLLSVPTQTQAAPDELQHNVPGWEQFVDGLRSLPAGLLAQLPAEQRADPQVRQEIARLVLKSLAASLLESIGSDGDRPAFVANQNVTLNYPQPNADTVYRVTRVTPGGTYRLRGYRGNLRLANLGQSGPMPGEPGGGSLRAGPKPDVLDLATLRVDRQGRFDLIVSPARPAGYDGDWWELQPNTTRLLLRAVNAGAATERDPTISIERLDMAPQRSRIAASVLEQRLRDLPRATALLPSIFVPTGARLRAVGYLNRFKLVDSSQNGGLSGQSYFSSVYELDDNEALLISVRPPSRCKYWSIQLASEFEETIDWHNNQSSLNDRQAKPDRDGLLRIVVASKDPGVANWLDTAGYASGIVEGRWTGCDSNPVPAADKLPLTGLRQRLPAGTRLVTPEQREHAIRQRRAALQQRPLW